jgi:hypothetical protein
MATTWHGSKEISCREKKITVKEQARKTKHKPKTFSEVLRMALPWPA